MLRHIVYVMSAILLGIAVMLSPLIMLGYRVNLINYGQQGDELVSSTEERAAGNNVSKEAFQVTAQRGAQPLTRLASSLPHAMLMVAIGLTAAIAVLILAKRALS